MTTRHSSSICTDEPAHGPSTNYLLNEFLASTFDGRETRAWKKDNFQELQYR